MSSHSGLASDGARRVRAIPVEDLDADLLLDGRLVHEVVDQDPGALARRVVVAERGRQVHVRALVARREEALADLPLEAARTDGVLLGRVDQHEVVHHRAVVEVRRRARGVVRVAVVDQVRDDVGDVAVLAGDGRGEVDRVVDRAVRVDREGAVAALDQRPGTAGARRRIVAPRIRERRIRDDLIRARGGSSERAQREHDRAQQQCKQPLPVPHVNAPRVVRHEFQATLAEIGASRFQPGVRDRGRQRPGQWRATKPPPERSTGCQRDPRLPARPLVSNRTPPTIMNTWPGFA